MSWFKVDDGSAFNAKVLAAGNEAWGAFCRVGAHCSQQLTDGHFSRAIAVTIAPMRVWTRLISVGLIDDMGRGEMHVHDYLQRNPSKETVLRERATTKQRVTDLRNGRRNGPCTPVQPLVQPTVQPAVVTVAVTGLPSRPVPSQPKEAAEPAAAPVQSETRIRTSDRSEEHALFEAKLRSLTKLSDLDARDLADQCVGAVLRGKAKVDWLLTALEEADAKSQRSETSSTRHARTVGFIRHAKAPKSDAGQSETTPSHRDFTFDPGEMRPARRAVPVRPKPADNDAPVTAAIKAAFSASFRGIGAGLVAPMTEAQLRDKAQADQRRLAEMTAEQERKVGGT